MKKIISLALVLSFMFSMSMTAAAVDGQEQVVETPMVLGNTKAAAPTNSATITFQYPNGGGLLVGETIVIDGKEYVTDEKGQITTVELPYGRYVPQLKISSEEGKKGFNWAYTFLSQKISIGAYSDMPQMQFLNNMYVYRKFNLTTIVVNSSNKPIEGMLIEVHKKGKKLFGSTITTCVAGVISFNWQELPASVSDPDSSLYIGDDLVIKAIYKGVDEKYESVEKPIKLSKTQSENFVRLVAPKKGETVVPVTPNLFETVLMPEVDIKNGLVANKGNVDLVYDFSMNAVNSTEMPTVLNGSMFKIADKNGTNIPIEKATLKHNHVYLTYDTATYQGETAPAKVSYTAIEGEHLVNAIDASAKVADFADVKVETSFDKNDDDFYRQYEEEVVKLVNEERARAGVPELVIDNDLMRMARIKSQDMAFNGYFAHQSLVYGYWHEQNKKFGLNNYYVSGENLANVPLSHQTSRELLTPQEAAMAAFIGWKNSPAHYSNMRNPAYTRTGVGFSYSGGFFTQNFASTQEDKANLVKVSVAPADGYGHMGKTTVKTSGMKGQKITVTATPHETFDFMGWYQDGAYVPVSIDKTYETTISGDINLKAKFQKSGYTYKTAVKTVEFIDGVPTQIEEIGGTAKGAGDYYLGKPVNLKAEENKGYKFYGWYFEDPIIPSTPGASLPYANNKMAEWEIRAGENKTITALFVKKEPTATLKIEVDPKYGAVYGSMQNNDILTDIGAVVDNNSPLGVSGGVFSENGKIYNLKTDKSEFIINLLSYNKTAYNFLYWMDKDTGEKLARLDDNKFYSYSGHVNLSKDTTLVPVFGPPEFTVGTTQGSTTNGIVKGRGVYTEGSKVTLTAIPNKGYYFDHWADLDSSNENYANATRTIESLNASINLTPVFTKQAEATITVEKPANIDDIGTVTDGGIHSVGATQTLVATTKDSSYKFLGWYDKTTDTVISQAATYQFVVAEGDKTIVAKYEKIEAPYTLKVVATTGGTATGNDTKHFYNGAVQLTASSIEGYEFKGWYENGRDLGTALTLSTKITGDTTIEARFAPKEMFTVTFRDIDGRIISMQTVVKDGKATLPAPSRVGYDFIGWNVNSSNLNKVTANYDVMAQYKRNDTYSVTVTNGDIVAPQKEYLFGNVVTVTKNDSLKYEADGTTKTELVFSHWERDGNIVSYAEQYSFMVDGHVAVTAVYTSAANIAIKAPLIALNNAPVLKDGKLSFSTQVSMEAGFTLVECGVVLSQTANTAEGANALTLETKDSIKAKSTMQSTTGQFIITKINASTGNWYGRGYMIYTDADKNLYTIYSPNVVS